MIARAVIGTARLTLRPLAARDEAAVVAGIGDFAVARWLTLVPHPYSSADFAAFLATARPGEVWALDDGNGACGAVSLAAELGFWLARPLWGRGYMAEAVRAVLAAHFAAQGADPVRAGYHTGNHRSARLLAGLGFRPDGFRLHHPRAHHGAPVLSQRLTLTREDWSEAWRAARG